MATTSIWRVKGYLGKVLLYAENPDKTTDPQTIKTPDQSNLNALEDVISYAGREDATEERRLVSGINCTPENAREVMMATKQQFEKLGGVIAYHGYQSFKEGEVTPELAHQIGKQLANELWGERYEVLIATHVDKESHIHNHFVLNTVSFVDGIKYHRTKEDYQLMRDTSDRLCREYGLSVVKHPDTRAKCYGEWFADKQGKPTFRNQIKADIDRAIAASLTEREFYDMLEDMGYEFKFTSESGKELQRPSLKPKGAAKFFRFDKLGEEYTVDEISNRILENIRRTDPFPEETQQAVRQYRTEHPLHPKASGLAALYYHYCYELHIIVLYPASAKQVSFFMREDLRKMDKLDAQVRLLGEHKIETIDDLHNFKDSAEDDIEVLKSERNNLRNKLKRDVRAGDGPTILQTKEQIAGISSKIQRLRDDLALCKLIEERSDQVAAEDTTLRDETEERKVENDEQLLRGSGGAGREDEPQRHRSRG